jgi:tetratricopeptide (TPR) repeat protein
VPELAPELRDRLALGLVLRLAGSLMNLGRFQEIIDLLSAHVERLDRVADPGLTGLFHFQAGLVWSFVGDNERSQAHARTAFEASREAGDQATMGKAQYVLALDGVWLGRPQEVIAHGTTAVALLERTGEHYWLALAHWILGLNYALVGRFDEALGEEAMCSEIGASVGSPRLLSYAGWATGTIRAFMGDAVLGIEGCRRSLERSPDPFNTATATGFLGYAYLENGQPREAIEHLERAIEMFGSFHYRHAQGLFTAYLSSALYLAGNPARARQVAADVIELDTRARFHYGKGLVRLVEGRIALAEGAHARALELFTEARAVFVSIEAQHEVARTELAVAELAHARGDVEACRSHAINARGLFVKLGVPRYVERAERLAGEWGVPLPIEGGGQRS